ncbi:amino acid ABC transporter permease [Mesorhizobium amorphae]|uniref:amino acid ABC transporter permease n=1 Tax=Mesorhizobium amorphae TaxID=71433 RepID=UPI00177E8E02|nr:amino acid ABC transporter permease [Mesorhizobium amorphae]
MSETTILTDIFRWLPFVLWGFALNILMSILAIMLGTAAGVFLGFGQISHVRLIGRISRLATQLFRNAPWLVLLFYCIFLMPYSFTVSGVTYNVPSWLRATLGFSVPVAANFSEIVRGAIGSIPKGQWEAAEVLGYTRTVTLFRIILPQCVTRMLPPWMNLYALLITATPLASIVGVDEALARTQAAVQSEVQPGFLIPMYLTLLTMFFLYAYPISRVSAALERRFQTV